MTKIQKESNSQHFIGNTGFNPGCCGLWQRYKKKAIHNSRCQSIQELIGVVAYDKDTKRKQFTTFTNGEIVREWVLWPMTKIQKESNSQPAHGADGEAERCCGLWQRYKKKAIHNSVGMPNRFGFGVVAYDKDTKRKQFTTGHGAICSKQRCCGLWQRYKKKAIHNTSCSVLPFLRGVVAYDKDTKRKQFTTPWSLTRLCERCCGLWQRYKKKAIHNRIRSSTKYENGVVTYDKDTKIHDRPGKHLAW